MVTFESYCRKGYGIQFLLWIGKTNFFVINMSDYFTPQFPISGLEQFKIKMVCL